MTFDLTDGTNSRVEQELTGAGYSAPISRLERIIDGEDIKPLSRIEDKMKQYIAGGSKGERYYSIDAKRYQAGPIEEDLIGKTRTGTVYDPHNWIQSYGVPENMPANVDSNGKWHVHAVGSLYQNIMNNGIYTIPVDTKKVKRIHYIIRVTDGFSLGDNRDDRKTKIALTNKLTFGDNAFTDYLVAVKVDTYSRCYQDSNNVWHWNTYMEGGMQVEDYNAYPILWLNYRSWGLDMYFDTIEFILKEG